MNEHVGASSTPAANPPAQPSDCTPEQLAHGRYFDALHDLVEDAAAGGSMRQLADVIAWTFARIAIGYGPFATGDMLGLVGKYMTGIETRNQAERDLARERASGHMPH